MTLDEMVKQLDKKMTEEYEMYCELHKALDSYRGRTLTDKEMASVDEIGDAIIEKYKELHPLYHFIAARYQVVVNRAHDFECIYNFIRKSWRC